MNRVVEIKGWHVLAGLIGMFGIVIAVNVFYVGVAISSFPGEDTPKSYAQGLHYNQTLAERAEQRARGWRAIADATRSAEGRVKIAVSIFDSAGKSIHDLKIEGVLRRPAQETGDHVLAFRGSPEAYVSELSPVDPGRWDLRVTATDADGFEFQVEKRVWLP